MPDTNNPLGPWMTARQAAPQVPPGLSKEGLLRLIRLAQIPAGVWARVGHRVFIHRERLEQWLASGGGTDTPKTAA